MTNIYDAINPPARPLIDKNKFILGMKRISLYVIYKSLREKKCIQDILDKRQDWLIVLPLYTCQVKDKSIKKYKGIKIMTYKKFKEKYND